jgi:hypothetical protein
MKEAVAYFRTLSQHLPGGTEVKHEHIFVRISILRTEFRTRDILNTKQAFDDGW